MALVGEVGELTELFQWLTPEESARVMADEDSATRVRDEMADVLAYLLGLADALGVDIEEALTAKMVKNAAKYPVDPSSAADRRDQPE
jgi:NTP pyrophosphatase (non-canonical NTP hydrolase)